jgi:hypothetical protein
VTYVTSSAFASFRFKFTYTQDPYISVSSLILARTLMHRTLGSVLCHVWLLLHELDRAVREYNPGRDALFPINSYRPWDKSSLIHNMYGIIPDGKKRSRGTDHPPTYSVELQERLALYVYSTSRTSLAVIW